MMDQVKVKVTKELKMDQETKLPKMDQETKLLPKVTKAKNELTMFLNVAE